MNRPSHLLLLALALVGLTAGPVYAQTPTATPPLATPRFKTGIGLAEVPETGRDDASQEAQRLSRQGTDRFQHGDLTGARERFASALKLAPGNAAIQINLGLIAYREKRYAEAEDYLRRTVRADLEIGLAWLILGVVYYEQDKLDAALAALSQATLLNPGDARAHHYLGVTIGKKGWYLGAEAEMRRAIELQPTYAEAHFNLAVFCLQRHPPAIELARRHYQRALDLGATRDPEVERLIGP